MQGKDLSLEEITVLLFCSVIVPVSVYSRRQMTLKRKGVMIYITRGTKECPTKKVDTRKVRF